MRCPTCNNAGMINVMDECPDCGPARRAQSIQSAPLPPIDSGQRWPRGAALQSGTCDRCGVWRDVGHVQTVQTYTKQGRLTLKRHARNAKEAAALIEGLRATEGRRADIPRCCAECMADFVASHCVRVHLLCTDGVWREVGAVMVPYEDG